MNCILFNASPCCTEICALISISQNRGSRRVLKAIHDGVLKAIHDGVLKAIYDGGASLHALAASTHQKLRIAPHSWSIVTVCIPGQLLHLDSPV